jgi:CheY-like chemotaxis protein
MSSPGSGDSPAIAAGSGGGPAATTASILVVGDDRAATAAIARILRADGARVAVASEGREALRAIADGRVRPTVLLTEMDLPGMTGIELAARVAAMRPGIRVVMMTGDAERAAAARRHPAEVGSVLLRPISPVELLAATRPTGDERPAPAR